MGASGDLIRRWFDEGYNQRKWEIIDDIFHEDYHAEGGVHVHLHHIKCRDDLKKYVELLVEHVPNITFKIKNLIDVDEYVVVEYTVDGSIVKGFGPIKANPNPPTVTGADVYHFEGGKIKRRLLAHHDISVLF